MPPKVNPTTFKQALQNSGFKSLTELALIAGVHRNTLYPLVRGEVSPFTDSYLAICTALKISPVSLLDMDAEEEISEIYKALGQIVYERLHERARYAFFLFGSRATGKARKFSDYDIGVTGGEKQLTWQEFLDIKERLAILCDDLPVKVSLLNFDSAPNSFLDDFESTLKFLIGDQGAFLYFRGFLDGRKKAKKAA
jgi:predicted nucleotidyltransferase